jgi:5'-deoxynucleotidase YfbR-like HD superfamily hydrolase
MYILEKSDAEILALAHQLREGYRLKRTMRYATVRDISVHNESVAEHVFALCYLLNYFLPLEDASGEMDRAKIYDILVFHDFGEIIPYHVKTEAHEVQEKNEALEIFTKLPDSIHSHAQSSWAEFDALTSREALFAYALDKVEPLFELLDPINQQSMHRLKFTAEMSIGRKMEATRDFPVLRRFAEVIHADFIARNVYWSQNS